MRAAPDKPAHHGRDHRPGGEDATYTGPWIGVGDPGEYEVFINGANAAPSADSPNPVPFRIRLAIGPPNIMDTDGVTILRYTEHQIEIQGDVTDVSPGDIVTVIRPEYRHDHDVPVPAHDDAGNYIACRLLSTGEFIYGVP